MVAAATAGKDTKGAAAPTEEKKPEVVTSFADMKMPEGMERADQPSLDGWFAPEVGNGFYGKAISHFQIKDSKSEKMRDVVIVGLLADCEAVDAETKKKTTLKRGQYLGVSVRHKLQPIMEYVTNKGTIFCKTLSKESIGGGQTMWNFELGCKGVKAAPPAPRQLSHEEAGSGGAGGDDDIPF